MIPFRTTPEQILNLPALVAGMKKAGLDRKLIANAAELASSDQGVYELVELWGECENDPAERALIVADIQDLVESNRCALSVHPMPAAS